MKASKTRNVANSLKASGFVDAGEGKLMHQTDGTLHFNATSEAWALQPHFARITYRGQGLDALEARIQANRQSR